MLQDTTIQAYDSIRAHLNEKQRVVRGALQRCGPMTNEALAEFLRWPQHVVTPRVLELRAMGEVIEAGYTVTKSGRKAHLWKLKEEPPAPKAETNSLF